MKMALGVSVTLPVREAGGNEGPTAKDYNQRMKMTGGFAAKCQAHSKQGVT